MNMSWLICGYCNLKHFIKNPTIIKKDQKFVYSHRQTGLCTKGCMKMGNVII